MPTLCDHKAGTLIKTDAGQPCGPEREANAASFQAACYTFQPLHFAVSVFLH